MTQARSTIVLPGQHAVYHCTNRCVRRAWLCGIDPDTKRNYEHRKAVVEARILQLGRIFSVGIYGYAVLSNHLHVVVSIEPSVAANWQDEEIVERWLQLYPARTPELTPRSLPVSGPSCRRSPAIDSSYCHSVTSTPATCRSRTARHAAREPRWLASRWTSTVVRDRWAVRRSPVRLSIR